MAGTTVEDKDFVHQALIDALAKENISVSREEANGVMGYPKPVAIKILLENKLDDKDKITDNLIESIHNVFVENMVTFYKHDPRVKEKPGVRETFSMLHDHSVKIAIDTGFSRAIANAIIERLGWNDGLIDYSITSDEVENGRPYPDMIYKVMDMAGVSSADQVIKIGDTISDIQQGRNAGCKYIIAVTTGACLVAQLIIEKPTHLVADLREIADIFRIKEVKGQDEE